ncbi:HEAT repeat-containing protein 6-like [Haliotis rufescens]|uniref:HEAT repeat-containing protein 6-like n=2 Tax=Haliotis TaxID=6452 RepID=UPI00201F5A70|nr:HEAT repeat-containing protein 6-like [Haliotis rufescens]
MAVDGEFLRSERETFRNCCFKLSTFVYKDDDSTRTNLNLLLDELTAAENSQRSVSEEDGNELLLKLSSLVPFHQERLIAKVCQTITNFKLRHQHSVSERCLDALLDFCIKALKCCQPWSHPDILQALSASLHDNCNRVGKYHELLLGKQGILVQLTDDGVTDEDVLTGGVQCLENLTAKVPGQNGLSDAHSQLIFSIFLRLLHTVPTQKIDLIVQCKILICALRGIQNLLLTTKLMPTDNLGPLLAGIRAYMFHGLSSNQLSPIPPSLYPTPMVQYDLGSASPKSDTKEETKDAPAKSAKKSRRKKASKKETDKEKDSEVPSANSPVKTETETADTTASAAISAEDAAATFQTPWMKVLSSDSEYSDTEGGQASRVRSMCTKVRQTAFSCFHALAKNLDKKIIFGYWSSFIPDTAGAGNSPQNQTLFTSILKDPSPMCRMGALSALTALVDRTRAFLAQAEENYQVRTAFVPFSAVLGSMIKELHRCLLLALVAENFPLALTQLIKCLGTLVMNVPYHRLHPGLLTRVIKQIRHFLNHRDPNVRVACLTCLGSVVSIQPPLMEVCHIVQPSTPPVSTRIYPTDSAQSQKPDDKAASSDSGFSSFSATDAANPIVGQSSGQSSGLNTPALAATPGIQTPVFSDQTLQAFANDTSWIIKLCIRNVMPQPQGESSSNWRETSMFFEPLPVRLESLQVLANLTNGYFPIIRKSVALLQDLIQACFEDKDPIVKLHGTKLLDELTQAMLQDIQKQAQDSTAASTITLQQVQEFWECLLSGPLPTMLQLERNNQVRANACDCISNIGPEVLSHLPVDRRVLCITLILGLTCEEDKLVKSAAVRALGVYVLFPCLREDVSFIADAANAILTAMEDWSVNVRMKAAWSMANMCDALALNRESGDLEFVDEFSDMLLLKLLTVATKSSQDTDKVKSNAVRAVGNLLRYLTERSLGKSNFVSAVGESVKALVKNILSGTMKVRWNACYAISNMFKNNLLPHGKAEWTIEVMNALSSVVKDCKNFKVRINGALALSVPRERNAYGSSELYASVWESLIEALRSSEDISDFAEFRYRDNLTDQIIEAIFHMLHLLCPEDLPALLPCLQTKGFILQAFMEKLRSSNAQFLKGPTLQTARKQVEKVGLCLSTGDDLVAMQLLTEICLIHADTDEEQENRPAEKSAFMQIYD